MAKTCDFEECNNPVFARDRNTGLGYCKYHVNQRTDKKYKSINKITKKQEIKKKLKSEYTEKQFKLFEEIWNERPHVCKVCDIGLGNEPLSYMFDHLIEKSSHPEIALEKDNILLVCGDCHSCKTNGKPKLKHKEYILQAIKQFNIL